MLALKKKRPFHTYRSNAHTDKWTLKTQRGEHRADTDPHKHGQSVNEVKVVTSQSPWLTFILNTNTRNHVSEAVFDTTTDSEQKSN